MIKNLEKEDFFLTILNINDDQMNAIFNGQSVTVNGMNDGENRVLLGLFKKRDQTRFYKNIMKNKNTTFTPDMYAKNMFVVSKQGSGFLDIARGVLRNRGVQNTIGNLAGQAVSRVAGDTAGKVASSVIRSGVSSFANNESAKDAAMKAGISGAQTALNSYAGGAYGLGGDVSNPMQPWTDAKSRMAYVRAFKKTGGSFKPL